ncbi:hypothetical protein [Prosthecobacter sp.]|uniref:hypothetical protein n=1 Tax=Prosthecobacter sp. TaxID=1965333 RepID=UPI003783AFD1
MKINISSAKYTFQYPPQTTPTSNNAWHYVQAAPATLTQLKNAWQEWHYTFTPTPRVPHDRLVITTPVPSPKTHRRPAPKRAHAPK